MDIMISSETPTDVYNVYQLQEIKTYDQQMVLAFFFVGVTGFLSVCGYFSFLKGLFPGGKDFANVLSYCLFLEVKRNL